MKMFAEGLTGCLKSRRRRQLLTIYGLVAVPDRNILCFLKTMNQFSDSLLSICFITKITSLPDIDFLKVRSEGE